jgi:hypothetical protein
VRHVFVDTSALFALTVVEDQNHIQAIPRSTFRTHKMKYQTGSEHRRPQWRLPAGYFSNRITKSFSLVISRPRSSQSEPEVCASPLERDEFELADDLENGQ